MKKDIEPALLRSFIAVAEQKSMTRAASLRCLTQSAVSQQIKKLESLLESKLFIRNCSKLELSRNGKRLLPKAYQAVRVNDELFEFIRGSEFQGNLRLGVPHDVMASMLPPALRLFQNEYPHVLVTLISGTSASLISLLNNGELDLAITTDRYRKNDNSLLFSKRLAWIGALDGDAFNRTPLSVAIGPEGCAFREVAIIALNQAKISWRSICQVGSLEPVFATLLADMAVAPFLLGTLPPGTKIIGNNLPTLPEFHVHLQVKDIPTDLDMAISLERLETLIRTNLRE